MNYAYEVKHAHEKSHRRDYLTTGEAAAKVGIHPNTLRWYEMQQRLPPIPRSPGGYRMFSPRLVTQARVVHACHHIIWMVGPIRKLSFSVIAFSRQERIGEAREAAEHIRALLQEEYRLAEESLQVLLHWRRGEHSPADSPADSQPGSCPAGSFSAGSSVKAIRRPVTISRAARMLALTPDQIRNWERNGLCRIPRAGSSGYRSFGREELERLLVIRYCLRAGYSLTAIRRMLHVLGRIVPDKLAEIRTLANTPLPDETALFDPFPTDTLPATLRESIRTAELLLCLLNELQ